MASIEFGTPEEVLETDFDRSLNVDNDISYYCDDFEPIPLDLHTACSIGHIECVEQCIKY
jgi:hypothetical protein